MKMCNRCCSRPCKCGWKYRHCSVEALMSMQAGIHFVLRAKLGAILDVSSPKNKGAWSNLFDAKEEELNLRSRLSTCYDCDLNSTCKDAFKEECRNGVCKGGEP